MSSSMQVATREERIARILDATLEVFSEFSFEDATTGEIARRAHVSKRDIYACYPTKQALLMGIVIREMQGHDESFRKAIDRAGSLETLQRKLESIGSALVVEILSPRMGVVRRLIVSESINQPFLGDLFFEGSVAQRCKLIAGVLAAHLTQPQPSGSADPEAAAQRYLSGVAYFPSVMTDVGLRDQWSDDAIHTHVASETRIFLVAHPAFASS